MKQPDMNQSYNFVLHTLKIKFGNFLATRDHKLDKRCSFWHFLTRFVKTGQSAMAAIRSADDDLTSAYT